MGGDGDTRAGPAIKYLLSVLTTNGMATNGAHTIKLSEYPFDRVRLACEKCERHGGYRKSRLFRAYPVDSHTH